MKLSVAMCTYNGEKYISEQIISILSQTVLPDELIICDDGSTDNTIAIIKGLNNPRIKLHQNPVNLGPTKNFEQAINLCSGDIIFLADQDDVWLPNKVATIVQAFKSNPEAYMLFTDAYLANEKLEPCGISLWEYSNFDCNEFSFNMLMLRTVATGATMALKKEALELIMPFSPFLIHDDWITLLLTFFNRTAFINKKLIYYRMHSNQQIGVNESTIESKKKNKIAQLKARLLEFRAKFTSIKNYTDLFPYLEVRLSHLQELPIKEPYLALNDYIEHLKTRSSLPKNKISRWKAIRREMPRYVKYENRATAIKEWINISL